MRKILYGIMLMGAIGFLSVTDVNAATYVNKQGVVIDSNVVEEFNEFVTAGHCFGQKGDSAVNLGSATKIVYNQTMDAAFVTTNSGVTITNTLNKTNYLAQSLNTSSAGYITTGTAIGKVGGKSGYQSGTIQSLNYSTTYTDGSYHSNLIKASNYNIKGDSGGPVFKLGTASAPTGTVIGVTAMGYEDGGNLTGFYNADTIATSLGITRY